VGLGCWDTLFDPSGGSVIWALLGYLRGVSVIQMFNHCQCRLPSKYLSHHTFSSLCIIKLSFIQKFSMILILRSNCFFPRIYEMEVCFQVSACLLSLPPISPHPKHALSVTLSLKQLSPRGTSRQMVDFSGVFLNSYILDLGTKKIAIFSPTLSYCFCEVQSSDFDSFDCEHFQSTSL